MIYYIFNCIILIEFSRFDKVFLRKNEKKKEEKKRKRKGKKEKMVEVMQKSKRAEERTRLG